MMTQKQSSIVNGAPATTPPNIEREELESIVNAGLRRAFLNGRTDYELTLELKDGETRPTIDEQVTHLQADIMALVDTYVEQAVKEARKNELTTAYTQVVGDESVPSRSKFVKRFTKYLRIRYTELSATPHQK